MKEIQLSQLGRKYKGKYIALVDDEDFERVNQFWWGVFKTRDKYYACRNEKNKNGSLIFMHGYIMGSKGIDHRDGNGLNCQKDNMRFCSQSQNMMNKKKSENKTSKYKGVCWDNQMNTWRVQVKVNYKKVFQGLFKNEKEAAESYNINAIKYHGEFAKLNII